jgi:hypothetical protein
MVGFYHSESESCPPASSDVNNNYSDNPMYWASSLRPSLSFEPEGAMRFTDVQDLARKKKLSIRVAQ